MNKYKYKVSIHFTDGGYRLTHHKYLWRAKQEAKKWKQRSNAKTVAIINIIK